MKRAQQHYADLLGDVYSWMIGDFDDCVTSAKDQIAHLKLSAGARVLDLGCGHGVFAVAAAQLGASVVAVDSCGQLIDELRQRAGSYSIAAFLGDMLIQQRYAGNVSEHPVRSVFRKTTQKVFRRFFGK